MGDEEYRDELPEDLDVSGYVGPYAFPDNSRRRVSGLIYLAVAALAAGLYAAKGDAVLVNRGLLWLGVALAVIALYHLTSGWRLRVRETDALVAATRQVGFPVGHASAQLAWRGLRSRPTWRILLYSADEPPSRRGLVLVDGIDGAVVAHFVEDNPEDWSEFAAAAGRAVRPAERAQSGPESE